VSPVRTTCAYCGVGCGIVASPTGSVGLEIEGDIDHPANLGRLCSKGAALGKTLGLEGRLLQPRIGARPSPWSEAIGLVARRFEESIRRYGPDSVAFYVSGQLLTEDYYVANKLMKGFIGSANIDTNSRLCMASAVVAHKQAFGADLVPGCYEDLDLADLVVFSGHNAAWTHSVLYRRMAVQRERGQRHVVIDPRRTDTAGEADLHLAIAPQTDVRLWNGLLAELVRRGVVDHRYLAAHVSGFEDVIATLNSADQSLSAVAADCGISPVDLGRFCQMFADAPKTVTLFSQGANQSAQGVAKGLAIINTHLATGRIGKPGACPFSITGQPNAMGGRETGGMANTLAGHMDFAPEDCDRVARFWGAPDIARKSGLKAVDMFDAVHDGRIKAIWVMATNPVVSLPNASRVAAALAKCPFVVVSDCVETDTSRYAHVALPALAWGEKDGTVTNSERCISRQRTALAAPGEARADWQIMADVAKAMGFADGFGWRSAGAVFNEWARLSAYENKDRHLNLAGLVGMTAQDYESLEPIQWPVLQRGQGTARLFTDGRFQTPDLRARMVPVSAAPPASLTDAVFPLSLNTGRIRDQWHTMTRTGRAVDLCRHAPEPYVELNPVDAQASGIVDGALTRVQTVHGEAVVQAKITDAVRPGGLFMPMHWSAAFAPSGRVNPLVTPNVDALSGQPEFKHTPARVRPYRETWRGFLITRDHCEAMEGSDLVWRRIPEADCSRYEFAGRGDETERRLAYERFTSQCSGETLDFVDAARGARRTAWIREGRLNAVLLMGTADLPSSGWLVDMFEVQRLDEIQRLSLLTGRPGSGHVDAGPILCACKRVAASRVAQAIMDGACNVTQVGDATGAGMTCGSCQPEIRRMLQSFEADTGADRDAA
jgi:assimilatory nitrate reductase catalytic subunit